MDIQEEGIGNSDGQWLGLQAFTAEQGSVAGWETRILQATQLSPKEA